MRKFIGLILVLVLALAGPLGCKCAAEKVAVENIQNSHRIILPRYLRYVEADAKLDAAAKDDEKKLVTTLERQTDALKNAIK